MELLFWILILLLNIYGVKVNLYNILTGKEVCSTRQIETVALIFGVLNILCIPACIFFIIIHLMK